MKIVYFSFIDSGGMLHYTENLNVALGGLADSSMVVLGSNREAASNGGMRIPWSRVPAYRKLLQSYNPLFYREVAKKIFEEFRPDIVHIASSGIGLLALIKALRARGVKVVYTVHDPIAHEELTTRWGGWVRKYQYRFQIPRAMRLCTKVHVHSSSHIEILKRLYGAEIGSNIYIVAHGGGLTKRVAEGDVVPPELMDELPSSLLTVLFFGRIEAYKGLEYLIRAVYLMEQQGKRVNLVIAGAGRIEATLLQRLTSNVILINRFIHDEEIKYIFNKTDVVVLPYLSATQSGVIPMAYSFGKPVVATDVGTLSEFTLNDKTGMLVAPQNSEALAEALTRMLNDPEKRKAMGKFALNFMNKNFEWPVVAKQHFAHYAKLVNDSAGRN